ncbi:hypothetical protein AB0H76_10605 [Nocardia sp. NPDC050712]|uniref:hypothetical protein n=1 Tax=Nocardia sp. NPDC050712 TaxID=3155518 RepID=UPI0033DBDA05
MSDSFLLATRIPMSRNEFEQWLDTPVPEPSVIANPEAMFDGWYWDGKPADWAQAEADATPREYFADCAGESPYLTYIVLYRDGALEAYLMHFGFCESNVYTALLMFAAAGRCSTAPATVLFWAETSGALREPDWRGWLATLTVGPDGARFEANRELAATIAALRPVEERFFELVGRMAVVEETGDPDYSGVYREPRFLDPAFQAG